MQQKVIIFSAPSGSGKTTLLKMMLEKFPHLAFSVSATTRKPRGEELHAKDYYFLDNETFREKIKQGEFVEFEEVYTDTFYGTLKSEVERIWQDGKTVIFDVDVEGGVNLKKYFGDRAMSVFIQPPSVEVLKERLVGRGTDSEEAIQTRLEKAEYELGFAKDFDHVIVNEDLATAAKELEHLIQKFSS